ncbi:MAG: hypothetical protein DRP42_07780 [Tenericutes bacterium]|nr:MAG: hypothetical protein DRP42_07780 [Mycoplasmatota bacterium]
MDYLLIIPARQDSKGILNKNLQSLDGLSLVGRACITAVTVINILYGKGHRVICSTDSPEIADVALIHGAEAPFLRPAELASDTSSTISVIQHALRKLPDSFDGVLTLQATSPFTAVSDVLKAIHLFETCGDPVVAVCENEHPVEWSMRLDAEQHFKWLFPWANAHQRQLTSPSYRLSGAFYLASPKQIEANGTYFSSAARALVVPHERSLDIDTPFDLELARLLVKSDPSIYKQTS